MLKQGVNLNISNEEYHRNNTHLSSSGIKLLYKDPKEFYNQYILGNKAEIGNQGALDFGTAAHTMILEPHLFADQIVVYTGLKRHGKAFDEFKAANPGKLILLSHEMDKLNALRVAFENHPHAGLLQNSQYEHTMCENLYGVAVKARADSICPERGIITDIKTTAYASGREQFANTVSMLHYEISAALYCEIAAAIYGKPFDFYFVVLSKSDLKCEIYKTSKKTMELGSSRIKSALEFYKQAMLTNKWEPDILEEEPNQIEEV